MKDIEKNKEQLIAELKKLRTRMSALESCKPRSEQTDCNSKIIDDRYHQAMRLDVISTLAGGIAHDFNNLLMGIQGNVSLMYLNTKQDHPNYKRLHSIEENIESGAEIIRQILGFARGGKYYFKPVNLNEVVKKTVIMFGGSRREISITGEYQENLYIVRADQIQIEQVLFSLFTNAWEAMPDGGNIYIKTRDIVLNNSDARPFGAPAGKYAQVTVTDNGAGMDKTTRQRVFEPYFTTKERGRGTGLGLAAAFGIIKGHGGMIEVESEKGKGTTVVFCLPALES
jgi:signal transduction histidine kinase